MKSENTLTLSLVVRPEWGHASSMRTVAHALFKAGLGDEQAAANAGMVASELAENAVKYGDWSRATGFVFRLAVEGREAWVEVVSPGDASSGSFGRLERILGTLRQRSAKEAYMHRLGEVAERTGELGQLGLLRIAHELGATITASAEEGRIRVRAAWAIDGGR